MSRLLACAAAVVVLTLVSVQFARVVNENVAMAHTLALVRHDVAALAAQKRRQQFEIRRLRDPAGAVPAIHDRLHLVAPNETIIYVKQAPSPAP